MQRRGTLARFACSSAAVACPSRQTLGRSRNESDLLMKPGIKLDMLRSAHRCAWRSVLRRPAHRLCLLSQFGASARVGCPSHARPALCSFGSEERFAGVGHPFACICRHQTACKASAFNSLQAIAFTMAYRREERSA
jgi:hypothetical protein